MDSVKATAPWALGIYYSKGMPLFVYYKDSNGSRYYVQYECAQSHLSSSDKFPLHQESSTYWTYLQTRYPMPGPVIHLPNNDASSSAS